MRQQPPTSHVMSSEIDSVIQSSSSEESLSTALKPTWFFHAQRSRLAIESSRLMRPTMRRQVPASSLGSAEEYTPGLAMEC